MSQPETTTDLFHDGPSDDPLAPVRVARLLVAALLVDSERVLDRVKLHRALWRVARLLDAAAGMKNG